MRYFLFALLLASMLAGTARAQNWPLGGQPRVLDNLEFEYVPGIFAPITCSGVALPATPGEPIYSTVDGTISDVFRVVNYVQVVITTDLGVVVFNNVLETPGGLDLYDNLLSPAPGGFTPIPAGPISVTVGQQIGVVGPAVTSSGHSNLGYAAYTMPPAGASRGINPLNEVTMNLYVEPGYSIASADPPGSSPYLGALLLRKTTTEDYFDPTDGYVYGSVDVIREIAVEKGISEPNPHSTTGGSLFDPDCWDIVPPNQHRIDGTMCLPQKTELSIQDANGVTLWPADGSVNEVWRNTDPCSPEYLAQTKFVDLATPVATSPVGVGVSDRNYCVNISGDPSTFPQLESWNTQLRVDEPDDGALARVPQEAKFKENTEYKLVMAASDLDFNVSTDEQWVRVDNFPPFITDCKIMSNTNDPAYEGHMVFDPAMSPGSGTGGPGMLVYQEHVSATSAAVPGIRQPISAQNGITVDVQVSEGMSALWLKDVYEASSGTSVYSLTSSSIASPFPKALGASPDGHYNFLMDDDWFDGVPDGVYVLEFEGQDYGCSALAGFSRTLGISGPVSPVHHTQIPLKSASGSCAAGAVLPPYDILHVFELGDPPCTPDGPLFSTACFSADFSPDVQVTVSVGSPVSFTPTPYNGVGLISYRWDYEGTNTFVPDPFHEYNTPGIYNVCLEATDATGAIAPTFCRNAHVLVVDAGASLEADFTASTTITNMATPINFFAIPAGGTAPYTFEWDFGDGLGTVLGQNPSRSYFTPGNKTVSLTITDATQNAVETKVNYITVTSSTSAEPMVVDFTFNPGAIEHQVDFSSNVAPYDQSYNYVWEFGDGTGSSWQANPNYQYSGAGAYTVTLTATNIITGETGSVSKVVTVADSPAYTVLPLSPGSYCVGETETFSAQLFGAELWSDHTYKVRIRVWHELALEYDNTGTTLDDLWVEVVFDAPGTYLVQVYLKEFDGADVPYTEQLVWRTFVVEEASITGAEIVGDESVCFDAANPTELSVAVTTNCSSPVPSMTQWYEAAEYPDGTFTTGSVFLVDPPTVYPSVQNYVAVVHDDASNTLAITTTVELYEQPAPQPATTDVTVCAGYTYELGDLLEFAGALDPTWEYSWASSTGGLWLLSDATIANPEISIPVNGVSHNYVLTITNPLGGCSSAFAVTVTSTALEASFAGPSMLACTGAENTIGVTATGGDGNYLYNWSDFGVNCQPCPEVDFTPIASGINTYTITVFDGGGCFATGSIVVESRKTKPEVTVPGTITSCPGAEVSLEATSANCTGACIITWSDEFGNVFPTGENPLLTAPLVITEYTATVMDDWSTCTAESDPLLVDVGLKPNVSPKGGNVHDHFNVCSGTTVQLDAGLVGSSFGYEFQWVAANGSYIPPGPDVTIAANSTTTYHLEAYHPITGCVLDEWRTDDEQVYVSLITYDEYKLLMYEWLLTTNGQTTCANPKLSLRMQYGIFSNSAPGTYTWRVYRIKQDGTGYKTYPTATLRLEDGACDPGTIVENGIVAKFPPHEFDNDNGDEQYYVEMVYVDADCGQEYRITEQICEYIWEYQCVATPNPTIAPIKWLHTYSTNHCNCNVGDRCPTVFQEFNPSPNYAVWRTIDQDLVDDYWSKPHRVVHGRGLQTAGAVSMAGTDMEFVGKNTVVLKTGFHAVATSSDKFHAYLDPDVCYSSTAFKSSEIAEENLLDIGMGTFRVFPNPATNYVNIEVQFDDPTPVEIRMFDSMGREVYSERADNVMGRNFAANVAAFQTGLYFVEISTPSETQHHKIILSR